MQSHKAVRTTDFNLENYLLSIGLSGFQAQLNLSTLTKIIQHHLLTFNYRNTDLYLEGRKTKDMRKIPSLKINSLFVHMVEKKGGYCLQQLELLRAALIEIGFQLDRHLAKIILQVCSEYQISEVDYSLKTHELLIVHLNNKHYLVDVGLGGDSLRFPLELIEGEQLVDKIIYRLTRLGDMWILDGKSSQVDDEKWFCYYHFSSTSRVKKNDINQAHDKIYLVDGLLPIRDGKILIGTVTEKRRKFLLWKIPENGGVYKSVRIDGSKSRTIEFSDMQKFESFSREKFKTF